MFTFTANGTISANVDGIAFWSGKAYACKSSTTNSVYRDDGGGTWTSIGAPNSRAAYSLLPFDLGAGEVLCAGNATSGHFAAVWYWNGATWTQVGSGVLGTNHGVYSLASHGGKLYAGTWNTAGGATVYRWDSPTWTDLGPLPSSDLTVRSMVSFTNLFATLYSLGSVQWNGAIWSAASSGGNLEVFDGSLYGASSTAFLLWNGTTFTMVRDFSTGDYAPIRISAYGDYIYVLVPYAADNTIIYRYDGAAWETGGTFALRGSYLKGSDANDVIYAGFGTGELYTYTYVAPPPPTPTPNNAELMRGLRWFYNDTDEGFYLDR